MSEPIGVVRRSAWAPAWRPSERGVRVAQGSNLADRLRGAALAAAREPLVQFLVAGFLLCGAIGGYQRRHDLFRIEVTPERAAHLAEAYRMQYGAAPDPLTRETLVRDDVADEMLYREGLALHLDEGDEIVRRRVIQKMRFLGSDLDAPAEPAEAQIAAYYRAHAARYVAPPSASFTHVFFSADAGGAAAALARARAAKSGLQASDRPRAPGVGDAFPDLYDFSGYGRDQVERLFGHTPFSQAVFTAPLGRWVGPVRSAYGWHLLRLTARSVPAEQPLAAVRDQVRTDLLADEQDWRNRAEAQALRRRFTVVRSDGAP